MSAALECGRIANELSVFSQWNFFKLNEVTWNHRGGEVVREMGVERGERKGAASLEVESESLGVGGDFFNRNRGQEIRKSACGSFDF